MPCSYTLNREQVDRWTKHESWNCWSKSILLGLESQYPTVSASGVRPLRSVSPNDSLRFLETISRVAAESCLVPGRSTVDSHRASSVVEAQRVHHVAEANSNRKPHSANHRSNERALMMIFVFWHPLTPTGRRDAGRRRRRLLWSRCDAGAIPCPGKWESDPQAQIRLGAHPRPGEESCCYLIAHGEVAQVGSLGTKLEARKR